MTLTRRQFLAGFFGFGLLAVLPRRKRPHRRPRRRKFRLDRSALDGTAVLG